MNVTLITYADEKMKMSQDVCCESALRLAGVSQAKEYGPENIDPVFYEKNKSILEVPCRNGGRGYWLFKPYFCYQALRRAKDGDIVIYSDSGVYFMKPVAPILAIMDKSNGADNNIFLFGNSHKHLHWCKMSTVKSMLWSSDPQKTSQVMRDLQNQEQVQASVIFFRACEFTRDLVYQWLEWAQIPGMIDDTDTNHIVRNHLEFREHRHDQALITNLAFKYNVQLHWWPVQYGHHIRSKYPVADNYPQLFFHHRFRDDEYPKGANAFNHVVNYINNYR